jgi:putative tryptophan/tyrosine transport system substrate-binding protein
MQRREFITLLGGAAVALPLAARAQQATMPVIGFMGSTSAALWQDFASAFRQGLREAGLIEGQNVAIEFRWANDQFDRLPALAAELASRKVSVIVAVGGSVSAVAAKAATATVPVIFVIGGDPVRLKLVESLNRPGGNVTGVSFLLNTLVAKRLELMRSLLPAVADIGVLVNPKNPNAAADTNAVQAAARELGIQVHVANAQNETEFAPAFESFVARKATAMFMLPDPLFISRRDQIVALAARHRLPAMYDRRELVAAGGLISYGTSFSDAHFQAGIYAARIIRGEKPAELPVVQPTKFEMVINLRTAKTLGLAIPDRVLAIADEVIE